MHLFCISAFSFLPPLYSPTPLLCHHSFNKSSVLVERIFRNVKDSKLCFCSAFVAVSFCLVSQSHLCFFVYFLPVVLSPSERALLPGAQGQVLLSGDRQRPGLPPFPQHRLQGPEAREHPAGLAGAHYPHRLRPVQGEHRAQRHHVNFLRHAGGKEAPSGIWNVCVGSVLVSALTLPVSFSAVFSS